MYSCKEVELTRENELAKKNDKSGGYPNLKPILCGCVVYKYGRGKAIKALYLR